MPSFSQTRTGQAHVEHEQLTFWHAARVEHTSSSSLIVGYKKSSLLTQRSNTQSSQMCSRPASCSNFSGPALLFFGINLPPTFRRKFSC